MRSRTELTPEMWTQQRYEHNRICCLACLPVCVHDPWVYEHTRVVWLCSVCACVCLAVEKMTTTQQQQQQHVCCASKKKQHKQEFSKFGKSTKRDVVTKQLTPRWLFNVWVWPCTAGYRMPHAEVLQHVSLIVNKFVLDYRQCKEKRALQNNGCFVY